MEGWEGKWRLEGWWRFAEDLLLIFVVKWKMIPMLYCVGKLWNFTATLHFDQIYIVDFWRIQVCCWRLWTRNLWETWCQEPSEEYMRNNKKPLRVFLSYAFLKDSVPPKKSILRKTYIYDIAGGGSSFYTDSCCWSIRGDLRAHMVYK